MSGLKIESVEIQNFKCHKHFCEQFSNLNILTGSNAAGKSSIIQAILLGYKAMDECDKKQIKVNNIFGLNLGIPASVISEEFSEKNVYLKFKIGDESNQIQLELPDDNYDLGFEIKNIDEILEGKEIGKCLSDLNLFFLNAERQGPRIISTIQDTKTYSVGNIGENTNYIISEIDRLQKLNDEYQLPRDLKISKLNRFSANCEEWLKLIIPGTELQYSLDMEKNLTTIHFKNQGEFYLPTATGFGITYILPIIVQALVASTIKNSVLIVENPEAHLHPYSQSILGKFLALVATNGVQVFIETHSEHIVDGCRIQAAKSRFCKQIRILFFEKRENESVCKQVTVQENGELEYWPEGFFDQKRMDLRELLEMRRCVK